MKLLFLILLLIFTDLNSGELDGKGVICKVYGDTVGYFFESDTSGEKSFEEFYTSDEIPDLSSFANIGIVKPKLQVDKKLLNKFMESFKEISNKKNIDKNMLVDIFEMLLPNFSHLETNKNLDQKM